jgi:GTP-binding protein
MSDGELQDDDLEAGEQLFASPARFLKSVPSLEVLPPADRPEIAFAGRSNVGKSSLINALVRNRGLARASNTPGRTQELNYFEPASANAYLVDMPGYGFAEAPKAKIAAWTTLLKDYLRGRPTLARVFLLVDSRHGLKSTDNEILELLDTSAVAYQAVLTKTDKIPVKALAEVRERTSKALAKHAAAFPIILETSSETGQGIPELRATIARVLLDHGTR